MNHCCLALSLALHLLISIGVSGTANGGWPRTDHSVRHFSFVNRFIQRQRHTNGFLVDGDEQMNTKATDCPGFDGDHFFQQKLDQDNPNDNRTWWQRYQVNSRYFNGTGNQWPIVFLMIGGEGHLEDRFVCNEGYSHMKLAKEHGALVVQLEHRFFGRNASSGLGDLSTTNLKSLLTLEQALADIAAFVPHFNKQHQLDNARWVAFGGSYPGSMAAWLAMAFPNLTVGNVASSAPLWPKTDFWEYSAVMEETIRNTSEECHGRVAEGFRTLKKMAGTDEGRERLNVFFDAKPKLDSKTLPEDITVFLSAVFGVWQDIIQYTFDQPRHDLNVTLACSLMESAGTRSLVGLSDVFKMYRQYECARRNITTDCDQSDFSYSNAIGPLKEEGMEAEAAESRAWIWMTCNEFGWYQTTDKENSIFGDIVSLGSQYQLCADIFGPEIGAKYIESRVRRTHRRWGDGCSFGATNVVLSNGRMDPWSRMGIREEEPEEGCRDQKTMEADWRRHQTVIWTPGAAHCSDLYPAYEGEPAALNKTRQLVRDEVSYFLESALDKMRSGANSLGGALFWPLALAALLPMVWMR